MQRGRNVVLHAVTVDQQRRRQYPCGFGNAKRGVAHKRLNQSINSHAFTRLHARGRPRRKIPASDLLLDFRIGRPRFSRYHRIECTPTDKHTLVMMVAREGIEWPTPAFSVCERAVILTT